MIYIAVLLILLGLIFLWKAFHTSTQEPADPPQESPFRAPAPLPTFRPSPKTSALNTPPLPLGSAPYETKQKQTPPPPPPPPQREGPKEPALQIEGMFYLDKDQSSRSLSTIKNTLTEISYAGIHHIGWAQLLLQGDTFLIRSNNASYAYPANHLDQIVFQDTGLALVPQSPNQAAGIFLSQDVQKLKIYVKTYSQHIAI